MSLTMSSHPRLRARGTRNQVMKGDVVRALIHTDPTRRAWLETELRKLGVVVVQSSSNVAELVSALVDAPPPRPTLVFIDFAAMSPGEVLHLHTIRELGWFGALIAVGKVSLALRQSLMIERVLAPNASSDAVRGAIANISPGAQTLRLPRITG